jgi:hypothetical protein
MGKMWTGRRCCLAGCAGFILLLAGCAQQDAEAMTRIGSKLVGVAADIKDNMGVGTQGLYCGLGVEARIAARLHWDKSLADTSIQVHANGGEVELKGTVQNQEQKRRAVELAENTVGVERVQDSLEIGAP